MSPRLPRRRAAGVGAGAGAGVGAGVGAVVGVGVGVGAGVGVGVGVGVHGRVRASPLRVPTVEDYSAHLSEDVPAKGEGDGDTRDVWGVARPFPLGRYGYVYIYMHTYICMYICVYIYRYIHMSSLGR